MDASIILPFYTSHEKLVSGSVESLELGEKQYRIFIPQNTKVGQKLRLKGLAGEMNPNLRGGDLYLLVHANSDPVYQVRRDIQIELPLTDEKMQKGSLEQIVLGQKKVDLKIPPGINPGQRLRLRGIGEYINGGYQGDLLSLGWCKTPDFSRVASA